MVFASEHAEINTLVQKPVVGMIQVMFTYIFYHVNDGFIGMILNP